MPCLHRFYRELLPKHHVEILFVGTFNPIWDVKHGDNPDYFYSRNANQFWCILPHALNKNCLIDETREKKLKFCVENKIGLTDLIYCIENVDELDAQNDFLKKGFKDEYFQKSNPDGNALDIVFFTSKLKAYIRANKNTLKAVFFTRKTGKGIDRIWKEWLSIKNFCESMNIHSTTLCSPSPRGGGIRTKIHDWRCAISPYVTK